MKCLFGIYSLDGGEILLEGKRVAFKNPKDALESGVAMVHQELNQALKRSVSDNIWLGRYPTALGFITREGKMRKKTKEIFSELGIEISPDRIMSEMSVSERQMVEIAKAVSYGAKIIVLDEPTSSLNEREVEHLFRIIEKLKTQGCVTESTSQPRRQRTSLSTKSSSLWLAESLLSAFRQRPTCLAPPRLRLKISLLVTLPYAT